MSNTLRRYDVLATTANGNSAVLDITKNGSGSTVIGEFISVAYSVTTRVGVPPAARWLPPRRLTARTVARHFPCI
jgi:hypothetical protein